MSPLVLSMLMVATAAAQQTGAPDMPHLSLVSAEIAELIPQAGYDARNRQITFRVEVAGVPPCSAERQGVTYTFLIDHDQSASTGTVLRGLPEIGSQHRLTIRCDPKTGRFVSSAGNVALAPSGPPDSAAELKMTVPARILPSSAFRWVVVAREGTRYDRLPREDFGWWTLRKGPW